MRIALYGSGAGADFFIKNVFPVIRSLGITIVSVIDDREDRFQFLLVVGSEVTIA